MECQREIQGKPHPMPSVGTAMYDLPERESLGKTDYLVWDTEVILTVGCIEEGGMITLDAYPFDTQAQ
jgi:hypothetical protein